jgi:putative DNA primase/helicase
VNPIHPALRHVVRVPDPTPAAQPVVTEVEETFPDLVPVFPLELKSLSRWIVRTADKHPYSSYESDANLGPIDPHDVQYQNDFDGVMGALDSTTKFTGAGFVFNYADGLTGVDFDDCVNAETLEIRSDILEIIQKVNSYAEFSPSRSGVHLITKGWQFPLGPNGEQGSKVGKAEMYSGKRYFTVTGNHVPGTPTTVNQADLGWLYERIVGKREFVSPKVKKDSAAGTAASSPESSCVVTIKNPALISTKYNTLMKGTILRSKDATGSSDFAIEDEAQILEYESQSSADYALLRLIADRLNTDDVDAIKSEFLDSPLGERNKATSGDYVERCIKKLLKEPRRPFVNTVLDEAGDLTGISIDRPKLLTEVGNGRRLIEVYGRNIRYCSEDGCWLYFGGKVWLTDKRGIHVDDLMKRMLIQMQQESATAAAALNMEPELLEKLNKDFSVKKVSVPLSEEELEAAKATGSRAKTKKVECVLSDQERELVERYRSSASIERWAKDSESMSKIRGSVDSAKSEPGISVSRNALDTNPLVCNVENGRFLCNPETHAVTFGKHLRDDLCTKMMPVVYDPTADCPKFKTFLSWMFPEKGVQDFVQTYLGLCLTGLIVRKVVILWGEGANGKSTLMKVLYHMFGEVLDKSGATVGRPYCQPVAFATFSVGRDETAGGARADLVPLKGARLISASESNKSGAKNQVKLDMARLKEMTGGDPTIARGLYQADETRFTNQGKIILQTNNAPSISDDSDGAWDRIELLACRSRVAEADQDERLAEKLIAESSGILNWLLEGLQMYFQNGLVPTESMDRDTEDYRGQENHMERFVDEECEIVAQETVRTPSAEIYGRYKTWCDGNGEIAESSKALTFYLKRKHKLVSYRTETNKGLGKIRLKGKPAVNLS